MTYVAAAYAITFGAILVYDISLVVRSRAARRDLRRRR
jgi:hypothetical protein